MSLQPIMNQYTGQVLYHYTSETGLLGILQSKCIRATLIRDLADESELVYGRELVARGFERESRGNTVGYSSIDPCILAACTRAIPDLSEMIRLAGHQPKTPNASLDW